MGDTPGSQTISTQLREIAEQAARYPDTVFNNLYHRINVDLLREAHRKVRISGNYRALSIVLHRARRYWRYWLSRRSHKGHINWEKFLDSIIDKFSLPNPRIVHTI